MVRPSRLVCALVCLSLSWLLSAGSIAAAVERNTPQREGVSDGAPPKTQRVTFQTADKNPITLGADYTPGRASGARALAPIAICLHMEEEDRDSFGPLVPALREAGFAVLALDLRGSGESGANADLAKRARDRDPKLVREMHEDVDAAYNWLAGQTGIDRARFVVIGAGLGADVAMDYAPRDASVDAVILLSPGVETSALDPSARLDKFGPRPLLVIAAEADRKPADDLGRALPGATVKIVPAGDAAAPPPRGTRMFARVPGIEKQIAEFAAKHVGPPSNEVVVASRIGEVYYPSDSSQAARLSPKNLRHFSNAAEAEARGYRPAKTRRR